MTTPNQPQYAAPTAGPRPGFTFKAADGLVALGGLFVFFFSFAPFFSSDLGSNFSENSWHSAATVFIAVSGLVLVASAFLDVVWKRDEPRYGLHRHVVQVGIALFALVDLVGFAFGIGLSQGGVTVTIDSGWGEILQLIGALIATAGAILNHLGKLQNTLSVPQGGGSAAPSGYPGYQAPTQAYPTQGDAQAPSDPGAPTQMG